MRWSAYERFVRPFLFCLPPESAHRGGVWMLKKLGKRARWLAGGGTVADPRGAVVVGSGPNAVTFPNAVGLAAGFDKDGEALEGLASLGFGFIEVGTVTPRPQPGNPPPRLFRFPGVKGLINAMGFNNAGVEVVAERLRRTPPLGIPLGINIGKNKDTPNDKAADDYLRCLERLFEFGDFFVVNVSSPNTPGLRSLQSARELGPLLESLRRRADALSPRVNTPKRPLLFVKLSPDESDYPALVDVVLQAGFDGIVATNTTRGREGFPSGSPAEGGASGAPLRARSTDVLATIARAARGRLALIGVGGIFNADDAFEKVLVGASLVETYTGFVYGGPASAARMARRLPRLAARCGFGSVSGAVGQALKGRNDVIG